MGRYRDNPGMTYQGENGEPVIQAELFDKEQPRTTSENEEDRGDGEEEEDGRKGRVVAVLSQVLGSDAIGNAAVVRRREGLKNICWNRHRS